MHFTAWRSTSQVVSVMIQLFGRMKRVPQLFGYDDGCHLHGFLHNKERAEAWAANPLWSQLTHMEIFIDRFHYPNHKDPWCKRNMSADRYILNNITECIVLQNLFCMCARSNMHMPWCCGVTARKNIAHLTRGVTADGEEWKINTEICEITFSWLQSYKTSARQMNEARFKWMMVTLCWLRNNHTVSIACMLIYLAHWF